MNHVHRIVWNEQSGSWVAVPETARSRGKGGGRSARKALAAALIASGFTMASVSALGETPATTVVPANSKTQAYISPNGVPVVDIAKANTTGLSHNVYNSYNVETKGLVLNNGNNSQMNRQSQLAGQVPANLNLVQEAKVILNEVVSTNRSALNGFTEVLGGRADVIVANPNGISCNGCGFINTDRATLTTGMPNIAGDGSLTGFTVNRGDVLIQGLGANASTQQIFDIVARSVKIDANINTAASGSLGITTGNNVWDYASRSVSGSVAGSGAAPSYAIDSTALGGMYAGRINIIATEAGVGVRMLGEAAASADDFTLSSAGKIEIQSTISAARDANIASTSATGGGDLFVNGAGAKISASHDLSLSATNGQVKLSEGELYAGNDLSLTGATLSDVSTADKTRFAGANSNLITSGAASIDGSVWGAGSALTGTFDSLTIGANGATIYAGSALGLSATNGLSLATAAVRSTGDLTLTAALGTISTAAGVAQGIQTTAGNLSLTAGNGLTNAGTITADAGSVTARIDGTLDNSGTVHAETTIDLADKSNGGTGDVINSGVLLADGALNANVATFTNQLRGTVQGTQGTTLVATTLNNEGTFVASSTNGQSGSFTVDSLTNSGALQSAENLLLNVVSSLANTGKVLATNNLTVDAGTSELVIKNGNTGVLQAGGELAFTGVKATFSEQFGKVLGNTIDIDVNRINNSGTMQSDADMKLQAIVVNAGTILSKGSMEIASNGLQNNSDATLQANTGSSISVVGYLENYGALITSIAGTGNDVLKMDYLYNYGTIQSAQNLTASLSEYRLYNEGSLIANLDLSISANAASSVIENAAGGIFQSGTSLGDTLTVTGADVTINNKSGALIIGNQLEFGLKSLINAGAIQGGDGDSHITVDGLNNAGVLTLANSSSGSGTIVADAINNTGTIQSKGAANFNLGTSLSNTASLLADGSMTISGTDSGYELQNDGRMQSGNLMKVTGQNQGKGVAITVGDKGVLMGKSMSINASAMSVGNGGAVGTAETMTISADELNFGGSNSRIVGSTSTASSFSTVITLMKPFSNPGAIHSGGVLLFDAPSITNTQNGSFSALNRLSILATGNNGDLINEGALYAGNTLYAYADNRIVNTVNGTVNSDGDISFTAKSFLNNNTINASQDILISAASIKNEMDGGSRYRVERPTNVGDYKVVDVTVCYIVGGCSLLAPDELATFSLDAVIKFFGVNEIRVDYEKIDSYVEDFSPALYSNTPTPEILSGRNLIINGFTSAGNYGGVISAVNNLTISGQSNASFVNDDYSLNTKSVKTTYRTTSIFYVLEGWVSTNSSPVSSETISALGGRNAGLFAGDKITINNTTVSNTSSSLSKPPVSIAKGAVSGVALIDSSGATSPIGGVVGVTTENGVSAISFGGLVITLPVNPNGYFVMSLNPASKYLVETNPLFAVGSTFVGSDYMMARYGYNPDDIAKRLGDSNYEAYLVRQQLITQTGNNILNGYGNEADQFKRLMDQAFEQNLVGSFTFGQALTAVQVASLNQDMVWMVETTVAGQKVLAPVVYLSSATRNAIQTGAVIAGNTVTMDVTSLTNTGGTISAKNELTVTSQGDITNTSGDIQGRNIALTSTQGSIVNRTDVQGSGGDTNFATTIGKTASISASGSLDLSAKNDIVVTGADVKASGDATLKAGGDITFDTIVNKVASGSGLDSSSSETNIGSNLESGGNLSLTSGGDTSIAGSRTQVGADLAVETGGSFNVLARQDKNTTETETSSSGFGVGGGLFGTETKKVTDFTGTNVGAALTVGGNAKITSQGDVTVQGSNVSVAGDAELDAKRGINILDGLDERRTTTTTNTVTFLKSGSTGDATSGSSSSSDSKSASGYASAKATANASAEASGTADLKFAELTTSTTTAGSNTSVASNLVVGGSLKAKTEGTLTLQGSNLEAGGDLSLDVKNLEVVAGRTEVFSDTVTNRTSVGIYSEGEAEANANADADASAGTLGANATAKASASASASGTSTLGLRTETESNSDYKLTNSSSTLKSGGNLAIKAKEDAVFVGADVVSGGNMSIDANNILNKAAQDVELKSSSKTTRTAGVYISAEMSADASAEANAQAGAVTGLDGNLSANVSAEVSAGLRYQDTSESTTESSTRNTGNSFKSGGNFSRTANDTIVDQATQVEAGGDLKQSARVIRDEAVVDKTFSSSSSSSQDARIGVYAGAMADASADVGAATVGKNGADAGAGAEASAGLKASYDNESASSSSSSETAVTSKFKAGGNINSSSKEATTLVGAQFESGGNVNIEAGSLNYQAAQDSTSSSSGNSKVGVDGKIALYGSKGVKLDAEYGSGDATSSSTTARAGSIKAGGNLTITTKGDATFVGTNLEAANAAGIDAGGNVAFQAATNTTSSTGNVVTASVSLSATTKDQSVGGGGGFEQSASSSNTAVGGSIKSGIGGTSIKSGGDTTLEGVQLSSTGNTAIEAGGNVNLKAAVSTSSESSKNISGNVGIGKGGDPSGEGGAGFTDAGSTKSSVTGIQSGGAIKITGKTITTQDAEISSGSSGVVLDGTVKNESAVNTEFATGAEVRVKVIGSDDKKKGGDSGTPPANTSAPSNANPNSAPVAPAPAKPSTGKVANLVKQFNDAEASGTAVNTVGSPAPAANVAKPSTASEESKSDADAGAALNPNSAAVAPATANPSTGNVANLVKRFNDAEANGTSVNTVGSPAPVAPATAKPSAATEESKSETQAPTDISAAANSSSQSAPKTAEVTSGNIGDNAVRAKNRASLKNNSESFKGTKTTEACVDTETAPGVIECVAPE